MPLEELERQHGIRDAIKLASNENPHGASARAIEAARSALGAVALYPDGSGFALREALARRFGVNAGQVTLGNGSNEILVLIAEAFLGPRTEAVYSEYAFLVYRLAVQAAGAVARVAPANGAGHAQPYGHDLAAMRSQIGPRTRLVYIANPNNPTGTWLESDELHGFIQSLPPGVVVVVDEAYAEYSAGADAAGAIAWINLCPNLVVTRTFSKIYGLAGLRVGYAVSHPQIADLLNRVRQPFNVNSLGQAAALAALGDAEHVQKSRDANARGREQLRAGLLRLGIRVAPSAGNFLLAGLGRPAMPVYDALLKAGIIVRPVANYGLPDHLRITVGTVAQNERVLHALGTAAGFSS
jgi:histidinol-phosphate aminotransferase